MPNLGNVTFTSMEDELEVFKNKVKGLLLDFRNKTGFVINGIQPQYIEVEQEDGDGTLDFTLDYLTIGIEKTYKD